MAPTFFVYILANKRNGTLYVGVTNNLARRLSEHKSKFAPGFTRKYQVDSLMHFEAFDSVLEARAREYSTAARASCRSEAWVPALRCIVKDAAPRPIRATWPGLARIH
jgi:putative endonuclease